MDEPSATFADGLDEAEFPPRRSGRLPLCEPSTMRGPDGQGIEVIVLDLSSVGFRAQCPMPVLIGGYVSLDLPGIGPVHGQVRWQVGGRMGAKFLDPVNLAGCAWTKLRPPSH